MAAFKDKKFAPMGSIFISLIVANVKKENN